MREKIPHARSGYLKAVLRLLVSESVLGCRSKAGFRRTDVDGVKRVRLFLEPACRADAFAHLFVARLLGSKRQKPTFLDISCLYPCFIACPWP